MNCAICNGTLENETDKALGIHLGICSEPGSLRNEQLANPKQPIETAQVTEAVEEQSESEVA